MAYLQSIEDIEDAAWAWEHLYKEIVSIFLKTGKAKIWSSSLPWVDGAIRREMN